MSLAALPVCTHRSITRSSTLALALVLLAGTPVSAEPMGAGGEPSMPVMPEMPVMASASPAEMPGMPAQPDRNPMAGNPATGNNKVSIGADNTVDLHVKDENITNVLEMLSIQSRKNIIASKNVSGKVSADLYGVTFHEVLDAILHVNGYGYLEQGNFIYVYTSEELAKIEASLKRRAAKVVKLNYLNAPDAAEFVKPMLSPQGEIKANAKSEMFAINDSAPVGKDDYALGATLVVIDYEENIAAIEKLIMELDTRPAQVLVESTVLQTTVTEDNAYGFDFSVIGDISFNEFAGGLGGPFGIVNAIRNPPAAIPAGLSDNDAIGAVGTTGRTDGKSTFKFGLTSEHITIVARLLDEVSDTTVLANPKLLTLNRQPARVLVGQRVAYLNTTATETSTTQSVEFLDTGVQLYFRPFVSANNEIRMELKPQVSDAKTRNVGTSGGQQVTVPDEITQEVVTNVIVPDGMTIVIGGLFRETTVTSRQQVPVVGDIPILGLAFRGQEDTIRREEIIFLVSPSIMNNEVLLSQGERAMDSIDRVRAGTRQGLLPFSRDKMTSALNVEAERAFRDGKYDEASWKIRHSLSLNPHQPGAYELREKLTGEREMWPAGNTFDMVISRETKKRMDSLTPPSQPVKGGTPWHSFDIPKQKVNGPMSMAPSTQPPTVLTSNAPAPAEQANTTPAGDNARSAFNSGSGESMTNNGFTMSVASTDAGTPAAVNSTFTATDAAQPTTPATTANTPATWHYDAATGAWTTQPMNANQAGGATTTANTDSAFAAGTPIAPTTPTAPDSPGAPTTPATANAEVPAPADRSMLAFTKVSVQVADQSLADVLTSLAMAHKLNFVVSNSVSTRVTADMQDVSLADALDAMLLVYGYNYTEQDKVFYIYGPGETAESCMGDEPATPVTYITGDATADAGQDGAQRPSDQQAPAPMNAPSTPATTTADPAEPMAGAGGRGAQPGFWWSSWSRDHFQSASANANSAAEGK